MLRSSSSWNHRVTNSSSNGPPPHVDADDSIAWQRLQRKQQQRQRKKSTAFRSFLSNQWFLCSQLPILILVVIASLDNADKQLLASSFPILEKVLHWDIQQLGYFSICTNLSYALSLPMWGWLIHRHNSSHRRHCHHPPGSPSASATQHLQRLLGCACAAWGVATAGIALVTSLAASYSLSDPSWRLWWWWLSPDHPVSWSLQVVVRCINGVALGSILPLSQSLLAEYTPDHLRGQAFGLMGVGEKLAGTLSSSSIVYLGEDYWQYAYYSLGLASIVVGGLARFMNLHPSHGAKDATNANLPGVDCSKNSTSDISDEDSVVKDLTLRQIVDRIVRLPAFMCLVAQGVFGGTPWDMMSFLLLLMDWKGFTKDQIVIIQFSSGLSSMLGGWIGGVMGDYAAVLSSGWSGYDGASSNSSSSSQGRILLALVSVLGGIPLYGCFLYATNFLWAIVWINLFSIWATWPSPGACRPICAELTNGPSERAQIVALWIVLEKVSGALFGAPLVGYLTDRMLAKANSTNNISASELYHQDNAGTNKEKADALAFNLFLLSSIFWSICAFFWFVMFLAMRKSSHGRGFVNPTSGQLRSRSSHPISTSNGLKKGEQHILFGV